MSSEAPAESSRAHQEAEAESSSRAHQEAEAESSSRAGQDAELKPAEEARQRRWVALSAIPFVPRAGGERAEMVLPGTDDVLLDLQDPPRASYMVLPERVAPDPKFRNNTNVPYIIAADPSSGRLLFHATQGRGILRTAYFLCDTSARTVARIPDVPSHLPHKLFPRRSIGLIADPRSTAHHHMVAQLHPTSQTRHENLLYYSTATDQWAVKPLASSPDHPAWGAHGVLTHDGLLWWVDIAYGMLVCDPFDDHPRLRLVPLPVGCEMLGLVGVRPSVFMDGRRCIRPSQGKLRYVEIRGLFDDHVAADEPLEDTAISMWTLVDPEGPHHWRFEYQAPLAEIWAHDTYIAAGLPPLKVPKLALIDPNNHGVVYLFQDTLLFALDVPSRRVLACEECFMDHQHHELTFQYSRFVDAWQPQPTNLLADDPSSEGGSGTKGPDGDVETGSDEELASLLSQMQYKSQPDEELPSGELLGSAMAPPSESSLDAGDQADEP